MSDSKVVLSIRVLLEVVETSEKACVTSFRELCKEVEAEVEEVTGSLSRWLGVEAYIGLLEP
jgi:hypothetical protein